MQNPPVYDTFAIQTRPSRAARHKDAVDDPLFQRVETIDSTSLAQRSTVLIAAYLAGSLISEVNWCRRRQRIDIEPASLKSELATTTMMKHSNKQIDLIAQLGSS